MRLVHHIAKGISLAFITATNAYADDIYVAVATNFATSAQALVSMFEEQTDQHVILSVGSSGKLFAQISNGAPFDVFLSADKARPTQLFDAGDAIARKTYAYGKLVFIVRDRPVALIESLVSEPMRVAIADPQAAPYGVAARQVLMTLRGESNWDEGVVFGESVGQAFGFVATGNARMGLIAKSQVDRIDFVAATQDVPDTYYAPIRQDVALIGGGSAALEFYEFLSSMAAQDVIIAAGYEVPE